jgi:hypothetical protein
VYIQNAIHPGENGGKDATMMMLRDVLVTKRLASWLDNVILINLLVFNADGHERTSPYNRINEQGPNAMGFRVTSTRLNLNRDYMKADAPEMRAFLRFYREWLPDLMIDNHVTDGGDMQYDVTIATHFGPDMAAPVGQWVNRSYMPALEKSMERDGNIMGWYAGGPMRGMEVLTMMTASPRYSTGYVTARNRASLLVETHSLKSFRVRTWSHFNIMKNSIDATVASAQELLAATKAADAAPVPTEAPIDFQPGKETQPYTLRALAAATYTGSAAGGPVLRYLPKAEDRNVRVNLSVEAKTRVTVPKGYYLPREWSDAAQLLRDHGISMETLREPRTVEVEAYRLNNVRFPPVPFEGRFLPSFDAEKQTMKVTMPAGSWFIPTAQMPWKLVLNLLEPAAPDALVRWGFFNAIFEQKEYFSDFVFEPHAEEMLKKDSKLREEFEAKLASDAAFRGNARQRLAWLHQRSPWMETDKDLYPVFRAVN